MHGKKSRVHIQTESPVFAGMEEEIDAARYHSLIAEDGTIPDCLQVLSTDVENGEIMQWATGNIRCTDSSSIRNPYSHQKEKA